MRRLQLLIGLLPICLLLPDCSMPRMRAHAYMMQQMDETVFRASAEQIWTETRQVLLDLGWALGSLRGTPDQHTQWAETDRKPCQSPGMLESLICRQYYTLEIRPLEGGGKRVVIRYHDKGTKDSLHKGRAYKAELQVLERLDPNRAKQIRNDANDHAGEKVL